MQLELNLQVVMLLPQILKNRVVEVFPREAKAVGRVRLDSEGEVLVLEEYEIAELIEDILKVDFILEVLNLLADSPQEREVILNLDHLRVLFK